MTMYVCVPLRLGVFVSAAVTLWISIIFLVDYPLYTTLFRSCFGGFALASRIVVDIAEYSGLAFAWLGTVGTWYGRLDWVRCFNYWQYVRLLSFAIVFYVDMPLIMHCEDWVSDVQGTSEGYGWNQLMYNMAMQGSCSSSRTNFFAFATLSMMILMYTASATDRYLEYMGRVPKHLRELEAEDVTMNAFYSHSLGERSHLNDIYGKYDHYSVGHEPVGKPTMVPAV